MPIAYRVLPIDPAFIERLRQTVLDDLGQPIERHIAEGGEPCRDALRRARAGEALILASYTPFALANPYKEFGPVFVLAEAAASPVLERLPMGADGDYFGDQFVLRAYSSDQRIVDAQVVTLAQAEDYLQTLLARPAVAFVLARFAGYGCYGCRIERAEP
ncbi:DUF1203 domain-containing protein [Chitinimonas sp.]|uniref:DUF1203 domain-containing protein n=1 Tax=Chitinimonas sp. TaxID=1934313 RepID=UPI0035B0467D